MRDNNNKVMVKQEGAEKFAATSFVFLVTRVSTRTGRNNTQSFELVWCHNPRGLTWTPHFMHDPISSPYIISWKNNIIFVDKFLKLQTLDNFVNFSIWTTPIFSFLIYTAFKICFYINPTFDLIYELQTRLKNWCVKIVCVCVRFVFNLVWVLKASYRRVLHH